MLEVLGETYAGVKDLESVSMNFRPIFAQAWYLGGDTLQLECQVWRPGAVGRQAPLGRVDELW
ncbi:MAG: hypothetical protein ABL878_18830, partial [Burkholderiales bacterium]